MSKIKNINFKNFRVYLDQEFEIYDDSKVIILYGNNGLGKTSFFDGIEWGLTGQLQRYKESSKEKNEYQILRNSFSKMSDDSYVEIKLDNDVIIKRIVDNKKKKDLSEGKLEDDIDLAYQLISDDYIGKIKYEETFGFSQFLSQELINNFVKDKDTNRYSSIKSILGLHKYDKYEVFINDTLKEVESIQKKCFDDREKIRNELRVESAKLSGLSLSDEIIKDKIKLYFLEDDFSAFDGEARKKIDDKIKLKVNKLNSVKAEIEQNNKVARQLKLLDKVKFDKYSQNTLNLKLYTDDKKLAEERLKLVLQRNEMSFLLDQKDKYVKKSKIVSEAIDYDVAIEDEEAKLRKILASTSDEYSIMTYLDDLSKDRTYLLNFKVLNNMIDQLSIKSKDLRKELKKFESLRNSFLSATIDYLKLNTNIELCPVCNQDFDAISTMRELQDILNNENDESINVLKSNISSVDNEIHEMTKLKETLLKNVNDEFELMMSSLKSSVKKLRIEKEIFFKDKNFVEDYQKRLGMVNVNFSEIESVSNDLNERLRIFEGNLDKAFLESRIKELSNSLDKIKEQISNFEFSIKQVDCKSLDDVKTRLEKIDAESKEKNKSIIGLEVALKDLEEIRYFYADDVSKDKIRVLNEKLYILEKKISNIATIEKDYRALSSNAREILMNETSRIIESDDLQIKKMYNYLNPNHNFEKLNIRIDDSNRKNNRLILEAVAKGGQRINPAYSFSSAQNNVLALSIFLSISLNQNWSKLNCIFMDDPIQNMDDINITNFVDLVRNIVKKTDKQIFISTHDNRIFEFMKNKFGSIAQSFEFFDYGNKM